MATPSYIPIAPYRPLAWQLAPLRDTSPVVLLTGSAGGGKSKTAAEKVHAFCLRYPGATGLILRKVKVSMTSGAVLMFERSIIGGDPNVRHYPSKSRFEYANGSIVAYAGLDDEDAQLRLKSIGQDGAVDIVWMEEATEFEESDFNTVLTRMRGRAAHWRQIILSTNPDAPQHWINRRLIRGGEAKVYYSNDLDNPHNPDDYHTTLEKLTGVERDRLLDGRWAQATGLIYDTWSEHNISDDADYLPGGGPVYWAVDDGYTGQRDPVTGLYTGESHPRCFLLIQERADGRFCVFAEHHAIHTLSDQHIAEVLALPYPAPDWAAVDKAAAELKGRIQGEGIYTRNSASDVEESIKVLRRMLAPDANGWRRVLVHPRCALLISEMSHYRRDQNGRIIKQYDHALDGLRYFTWQYRIG